MIQIEKSPQNIEDLRATIVSDLRLTGRDHIEDLIEYLDDAKFFTAPASTKNHLFKDGGLAEHSYNVYKIADTIARYLLDFDTYMHMSSSICIAAYLHDVGKCGQFGMAYYVENILKSGKRSDAKPYEINKDLLPVPHSMVSIVEIQKRIELTQDEQFAILCHDGLYGEMKYVVQGHENLLYLLIHNADMLASRILETEGEKLNE